MVPFDLQEHHVALGTRFERSAPSNLADMSLRTQRQLQLLVQELLDLRRSRPRLNQSHRHVQDVRGAELCHMMRNDITNDTMFEDLGVVSVGRISFRHAVLSLVHPTSGKASVLMKHPRQINHPMKRWMEGRPPSSGYAELQK